MILYCAELDQIILVSGFNYWGGGVNVSIMPQENGPDGLDLTELMEGHDWIHIGVL